MLNYAMLKVVSIEAEVGSIGGEEDGVIGMLLESIRMRGKGYDPEG